MLVNITGAKVKRGENCYEVIYKEQVIFESKLRDIAISVALSKKQCEILLTENVKTI